MIRTYAEHERISVKRARRAGNDSDYFESDERRVSGVSARLWLLSSARNRSVIQIDPDVIGPP